MTNILKRYSLLAGACFLCFISINAQGHYPYANESLAMPVRLNDLVNRLTIQEKISLLWESSPAIPRLGISKYYYGNETLHGIMRGGKFTVFPQAIALAASWDTTLLHTVATAISDEARGKWNELNQGQKQTAFYSDLLTFWSPTINMARDPRWGRTAETYGEDPWLTARLSVAFIKGLQGDDKKYIKVVATPKHFAVHNQEANRSAANSIASEKTIREYYFPAFKASIVEGKALSIMSAYNQVNWVPATANHWLLKDVLRDEWGFKGFVVSDCGAVCNMYNPMHYTPTPEETAAAAIKGGMDLECSGGCTLMQDNLLKAYNKGLVTKDEINNAVKNVLRVRFQLGLFDAADKNPFRSISPDVVGSTAHQQLALEASRESIVLLKNNGLLPINSKKIRSIAIVGHNADIAVFGGYSGTPKNEVITPLQGIRDKAKPKGIRINYVPTRLDNYNLDMIPATALQTGGMQGLQAEYYTNRDLAGTPVLRIDPQVNLHSKDNPPDPFVPVGNKSIRWQGDLVVPVSGWYLLGVSSDDGVRLWFNDELKVDSWRQRGEMVDSFRTQLEAGKKYKLKIEYFDVGGDAACRLWWRTPNATVKEYTEQVEAAKKSDLVIAVIGTGLYNEREGHDKESLALPGDQMAMLQAVYKANLNTVVVLVTGSQHTLQWMQQNVPAIINAWYPGEQGGSAIADVLFGNYNPAGRLPLTYYEQMDSLPPMDDYEIKKGRTYMYYKGHPLYPFGYGLSYTNFSYTAIATTYINDIINVAVSITNTGKSDGDEVPQVYSYLTNEDGLKVQQLRAFARIHLKKGETKNVVLPVRRSELAYWSEEQRRWKKYTGEIEIQVGASSADIRQRTNFMLK